MTIENKASDADNLEALLSGETVPEKFRGKKIGDVLRSYSELESAHSRQGQELGELRRLNSSLIDLETQTSKKTEQERTPVDTETLLADPDKAINEVIETHPAVREAKERSAQLERQLAMNDFEKRHPSFREDVQDPEFRAWIQGNAALGRLAAAADAYDMQAADTLFSLWNERKQIKANIESKRQSEEEKRQKERAGTLEGGSGSDASSESTYSRAEIIDLRRRANLGDPSAKAKWEASKAAIYKAYQEGRVS